MFLLYQKKYKTYPEEIFIDGKIFHINADFRNILRIFGMISDVNIPENKKLSKLKEWFFDGESGESIEYISNDILSEVFIGFFRMNREIYDESEYSDEYENTRQFCYDFDAEEIYADFLREYNIDLIEVDFLHWYKFKILLGNLSAESMFRKKIELRFMDLSKFQDNSDGGRRFIELAKAKDTVKLPVFYHDEISEDLQEIKEFNEIWGKAGNN